METLSMMPLVTLLQSVIVQSPVWDRIWRVFDIVVERALSHIPQVVLAIGFIALTHGLSRTARTMIMTGMGRTKADANVRALVAQTGFIAIWMIGVIASLSILDVNMSGFVAGLGMAGAAIGLALRDIIANFVAGIILLTIHPFRIGDTIIIEGLEGMVENIQIRATTLKTAEGRQILIPNNKVFVANIVNLTAYAERRGAFFIKIAPWHKPETVCELLQKEVQGTPGVNAQPPAAVRLHEFGGDFITLEVSFWVDARSNDFGLVLRTVKERTRACLLEHKVSLV